VFDESRLQITLIEAGPRILPALSEKLAAKAQAEPEELGVRVCTGVAVTEAIPRAVITKGGERIEADLMVWAAGVKAPPFLAELGLEVNRANQIVVRGTLQSVSDDRIFAIGDCCSYTPPGARRPVPPGAQAAHQMASAVFSNLLRLMDGRALKPFIYRDHGSLVSLSRFSTVGSLMGNLVGGRMAVEGRLARLVYTSLHRMHLIAIHGWLRGWRRDNRLIRPPLKLH
jgi:NADH dehydrogenase